MIVRVPLALLKMAPPLSLITEFPEMVELEMVRVPALKKAPPLLLLLLDPVTVTPEILRFPPVSMVKIPRLPLLASIVSEDAPRPLMVRVPAVLTFKIVGRAAAKVMVYGLEPVKLKLMSSLPGLLARVIAASRDPVPEAAVVVT